ncbi:anti-sigma factor [Catenovulum adriaticum]|uniref:Anti-sigma factor n=1 Tax=Catenovulum adriaticum TaxID=2984846 RepID=A0ABY7APQ9_9ALTE|nr:anti-sigma factor [Catenovulum sp. TS8]WAJ70435.1 anti-sigma factor [Catenovulum sp. TS8]
MNYLVEDRRNALAAQYVLGTLRGGARRRYQQLMMQHQLVRETTWIWEQYINVLGHKLEPKTPSDKVWVEVSQRLGFDEDSIASTRQTSSASAEVVELKSAKFWPGLASIATAAAIILAVILVRLEPVDSTPSQFAVVQSEKAQALWLIEVGEQQIKVKATDKLTAQANNDYELWFVASDGRAPVSLGLLPKSGELNLAKSDLFGTVELAALAVSLEPLGGSPSGSPTKVLYTTELVTL